MSAPRSPQLVLGPGIEIVPVRELPAGLRELLGGDGSDFVLSDRTARSGSQRIDEATARLLRKFSEPRRVVDAILAHAEEDGLDPSAVLAEAYPLVRELRAEGTLIDAAARARSPAPAYAPGDELAGCRVVRLASELADTELYEALAPDGGRVAIKRVREDAPEPVREALGWEVAVLDHLGQRACGAAPRLVEARFDRPDPLACIEWCDGEQGLEVARGVERDLARRGAVAGAVVRAYVALHDAGVVHGDVHPANVLVAGDTCVRLVDFGGAHVLGGGAPQTRIGTVPYYEPELARALAAGAEAPPPTPLGEQYAVAALAYTLIAQAAYVPLSLELEIALGQIVAEPPRPFAELGISWPAVEEVLARALAKGPAARFADMAALADALDAALDTPGREAPRGTRATSARRAGRGDGRLVLEAAEARLVERCGLTAEATGAGLATAPTASVYAGAAGVAVALLRIAGLRGDPELLAAADAWNGHALRERASPRAFHDGSVGPETEPGPRALLHSATGLHAVEALVRHASGDEAETLEAVDAFVRTAGGQPAGEVAVPALRDALRSHPLDATQGAASLLLGSALLLPICPEGDGGGVRARLERLGAALAAVVLDELVAEATPSAGRYLGFAHGRSGALRALLGWARASGVPPGAAVVRALEELADRAVARGGGLAWPVRVGEREPPWTGWCHGSAGHLLTWLAAADVLGRDELREIAVAAGRHVWSGRGHSGPSLCCGGAGEALALLELARSTGDAAWARRGRRLAVDAARDAGAVAHAQGLFRSDAGVALAAAEALRPETACWPLWGPPL